MNDTKAIKIVLAYYDCKIDMEMMHNLLLKHFGNYKTAVLWLANNDYKIKNLRGLKI